MGDERVERLYLTYGPMIFGLCRRLLADDAAAEDATQETFVRVHRHLDEARDPKAATAWIYRIATNYCLNEIRDRKLRPLSSAELPEDAVPPTTEDELGDREVIARLLVHVPEKLRAPAWLHFVDELPQEEVARILGVSRRTIVTRLADFTRIAAKYLRRAA